MLREVPKSWSPTTLAAACEFFTDGDWVETKDQNPDGEVRLIQLADIGDGAFLDKSSRFLTAQKARELRCSLLEPDDLLIARMADPIARCCLFPGLDQPAATVVDVAIARARKGVDQRFLSYAVSDRSFRELALGAASGTTRSRVSRSNLGALPILLPPLDEQRRIAGVLRSVDLAIEAAFATLSQTREARAHQLERLMALPGEMRPLTDVCRLGGGSGFPIKHQGKREGAYPFAKVSDMNRPGNETELKTAENYVDEADLKVLRAKPFPPGTTFLPKVGATLLTNKRRIAVRETIVDNNVMGAVPTDIDPWFLFYAFSTIDMGDYVQPGAVPSVNQGTVGKIMIPVPARKVQERYVNTMRDLDRTIEAQRAAITTLIGTKAAVSSDLLSGSVRVPA